MLKPFLDPKQNTQTKQTRGDASKVLKLQKLLKLNNNDQTQARITSNAIPK